MTGPGSISHRLSSHDAEHIRHALYANPLFDAPHRQLVDAILPHVWARPFAPKRTIATEDRPCEGMYVVIRGRVKVQLRSAEIRSFILEIIESGASFGENALLENARWAASYVAMKPTVVAILPRQVLEWAAARHPDITRRVLQVMAARVAKTQESMAFFAGSDVRKRLVRCLAGLSQCRDAGASREYVVEGRPTQDELAQMTGASRETISRTMHQLEREGLISTRGRSVTMAGELINGY